MKYIVIILVLCASCFASCKTTKEVVRTVTTTDSTAIHQRDSLSMTIQELTAKHERELSEIRNTGITFQPDCDTVIIDANCNYDSAMKVIGALKSTAKFYKDGSFELSGKIASISNLYNRNEKELDSLGQTYYMLMKEHEDSTILLRSLREQSTKKVKRSASGIMWWLVIAAGCLGVYVGYKGRSLIKSPA